MNTVEEIAQDVFNNLKDGDAVAIRTVPNKEGMIRFHHSALDDVLMDHWLLDQVCQHTKIPVDDYERLWKLSEDARVPRVMTFGKHKGKPVEDVDRGYAAWYRKQPDPDPYMLEAFRRAGLIT